MHLCINVSRKPIVLQMWCDFPLWARYTDFHTFYAQAKCEKPRLKTKKRNEKNPNEKFKVPWKINSHRRSGLKVLFIKVQKLGCHVAHFRHTRGRYYVKRCSANSSDWHPAPSAQVILLIKHKTLRWVKWMWFVWVRVFFQYWCCFVLKACVLWNYWEIQHIYNRALIWVTYSASKPKNVVNMGSLKKNTHAHKHKAVF